MNEETNGSIAAPSSVVQPASMLEIMQRLNASTDFSVDDDVLVEHKQETPLKDYMSETGASKDVMMKDILSSFYAVNPEARIAEKASTDPKLMEAIETVKTPRGVSISGWNILVDQDENGLKTYDIISEGGVKVAANVNLYDVAYGIVKHMKEGKFINDPKVIALLSYDTEYGDARHNASYYKHMYESGKNPQKEAIYESRFQTSVDKLKKIRTDVKRSLND